MTELSLVIEKRAGVGKNASRRLRAQGKIPAIVYGGGDEPVPIQVDRKEMVGLLSSDSGENTVFLLKVPGTKEKRHTMIRELQIDRLENRVVHIDFVRVDMSQTVRVKVAIHLEGIPEGVKTQGGMIDFVTRELEVECLPSQIPDQLSLDVADLVIGMKAEAGDIELPDELRLLDDASRVIVSIAIPKVVEEEEEEEELLEADLEEPEVTTGAKEEKPEDESTSGD